MMPGIIPSLLMAGASIAGAAIDPPLGSWSGSLPNYYADFTAQHTGGTAPFTYLWTTENGSGIANPALRNVRITSHDGSPDYINLTITDAAGQVAFLTAPILGLL